ncbi:MAG: PQQ-binding-like beta-propeller repeat protein, partial [Thermoplasmatales archaeon]|nr:PQQ-binding-like beta-propeller repeat protein [Thermoplasmatales archaeon]
GPMDSAWPMKCHDTHHTGRSPYGTANNSYYELWRYKFDDRIDNDPAIGEDGTIYVGGSYEKLNEYLYAINPDGTMKWKYRADGFIWLMCPAIAEDGTIYFGSWDDHLHAVNPNGTRKWRFDADCDIVSDPVIGGDGTIYFGTMWCLGKGGKIFAVNPDGTKKWHYKTGGHIVSDPAIGDDGTIYIGSDDRYLYAMNSNGTLRWRFKTGDWVGAPPSIADDGTVYISSYDDYLYALYPNGTLRWKTEIWYGSDTNPSIGLDGTIYICSSSKLFAINPDGSIKWEFKLGGGVMRSSSAICADGIIYTGIEIGDMKGGEIVAVNPDGTLRWRKRLSNQWIDSSPCIGEDGIVYIVSSNGGNSVLHAFGTGSEVLADANGPYYGLINMPLNFSGYALYGYPLYSWFWDFGDGDSSDEQNPSHIYDNPGNYTVILNVSDDSGNTSEDSTWAWIQESNNPPDKPSIDGEINGKMETSYDYNFTSTDPEGLHIWYYIEWGDGQNTGWIGSYMSGETITKSHTWWAKGEFTIRCKAKDPYGDESEWGTLDVTMPKNQQSQNWWFLQFLQNHLRMFPIIRYILGL